MSFYVTTTLKQTRSNHTNLKQTIATTEKAIDSVNSARLKDTPPRSHGNHRRGEGEKLPSEGSPICASHCLTRPPCA